MKPAPTEKDQEAPAPDAKVAARDRVRKHRESLRAQGLRPIQIWVPDTRKPGFAEEARRQSLAVSEDPDEQEIYDFIDAVMEGTDWS